MLDRGSCAVIGSPWPLDAAVPAHWLPEFLQRWTGGLALAEANFLANRAVDSAFSLDNAKGLAMTAFSDPLLRFAG